MDNITDSQRLDRLENHFKVYKSDVSDIKDSLKEVRMLLGGTELNGKKGFINLMETVEQKVDVMEKEITSMKKDLESVKFWGRGSAGILFASILVIVKAISDKL